MRDVVVLLVFVAFTVLCVGYVWWCDRIIGPDPVEGGGDSERHREPLDEVMS